MGKKNLIMGKNLVLKKEEKNNTNSMEDSSISSHTNNQQSLNSIKFKEKIDTYRAKHILSMKYSELIEYYQIYNNENEDGTDTTIDKKEMIIEILKARKLCAGYLKIDSDEIEREYKSTNEKRHYVKGAVGLQLLPSFIRNYLGHKLYDHDIINSHPTIMVYLSSQVNGLDNGYLKEYINDREQVLKKNNISKNGIIELINQDNPKKQPTPWLSGFVDEIKTIKEVLLKTIQHSYTPNMNKKNNPKSSVFSQILHKYETMVMKLVYDKYKDAISVPMYDGFLAHSIISIDELNELTTEYGVKWKHKDIDSCIIEPESINDLAVKDYGFLKTKWEKEVSFISQQNTFIINANRISLSNQAIINWSANWTCPNTEDGKMEKFLPQWLSDVDRYCFDTMDFYPYNKDLGDDPTPKNVYNTFIPFKRNKIDDYNKDEIPPIFKEYLEKGYEDEVKIEYIIKYLSHLIKYPEELPEVIIVLKGLEGAGKDSLIKLITALIGITYVFSTEDIDPVFGNFNGSISGKLVVQLNEMEQKKFIPIQEGLKDYATRQYNNINEKYLTARIEKNRVRMILISNHYDPVLPSATDRRYIILLLNDLLVNNREFWDKFYDWLGDDKEMDKLYTYLLNYDISNWKPKDRLITNEYRIAQYNNIQPYIKYLYITLCKDIENIDKEIYLPCDNGEYKILKSALSIELEKFYKDADYGYKKKKVNEYLTGTSGITKKRCASAGEYYMIDVKKLENTLLNSNGLKGFLDFFEVSDNPF